MHCTMCPLVGLTLCGARRLARVAVPTLLGAAKECIRCAAQVSILRRGLHTVLYFYIFDAISVEIRGISG